MPGSVAFDQLALPADLDREEVEEHADPCGLSKVRMREEPGVRGEVRLRDERRASPRRAYETWEEADADAAFDSLGQAEHRVDLVDDPLRRDVPLHELHRLQRGKVVPERHPTEVRERGGIARLDILEFGVRAE